MAHTPTPWSISYGYDPQLLGTPAHYIAGPDPKSIGIKLATPWREGAWDNDDEARDNAALIVKAVNAYQPMLEALEEASDILAAYVGFLHGMPAADIELHPYIPAVEGAFEQVGAAIALAKSDGVTL